MSIAANLVKDLRERTGAGMMECKKALVDSDGNIEAAIELLRTRGQAKAEKKAGRIAAEGQILTATSVKGDVTVMLEVNCETDFVAKDDHFMRFASAATELAAREQPATVEALMALPVAGGQTLEEARRDLVAKIGENIGVRRFEFVRPKGKLGGYFHGTRIGVLVDFEGGDEELGRDLAMHIAASNPRYLSPDDVPEDLRANERRILTEQAAGEGKPPEIVAKMVEGRLRKYLNEIALVGQPFVKDPDTSIAKLLKDRGARVHRFVRLEVGEGIEKKTENIAEAVAAMHSQG
ncbi:MAG: translation elongation factor Ts [Gammaproteobacteria bacterium]